MTKLQIRRAYADPHCIEIETETRGRKYRHFTNNLPVSGHTGIPVDEFGRSQEAMRWVRLAASVFEMERGLKEAEKALLAVCAHDDRQKERKEERLPRSLMVAVNQALIEVSAGLMRPGLVKEV